MRNLLLVVIAVFFSLTLKSQTGVHEGSVTFITSGNIYVQFISTSGFHKGDTLFIKDGDRYISALKITAFSSISCVCSPLSDRKLNIADKVFYHPSKQISREIPVSAPAVHPETEPQPVSFSGPDTSASNPLPKPALKQSIHGYVNLASYTDWSNNSSTNTQREKLTFSLTAKNIGSSNLSAECYITYYQNKWQWNETANSVFNKLKIYNLDFRYDFSEKISLVAGRRVNPRLSGMGPNDGLQAEFRYKPIGFGILAGFRPNFSDYGFNVSNFQAGGYLFNEYAANRKYMQTVLAFIDQTNNWKTDRRYLYLQHSNAFIRDLSFYGSAEMDLFAKEFSTADSSYKPVTTFRLSYINLSLNWRIYSRLAVSVSYNIRKNIIYYETYKDFLDKILDTHVLQGYIAQATFNPFTNLYIGLTGSYRYRNDDPEKSKNIYGYLSYNMIPGIKSAVTVSVVYLGSNYLDGKIYSIALTKDILSGKLFTGLTYRYVEYNYRNPEFGSTIQNMGEVSLTWRIIRKLALIVYYEGTFEKVNQFNRVYAQLNMGF